MSLICKFNLSVLKEKKGSLLESFVILDREVMPCFAVIVSLRA